MARISDLKAALSAVQAALYASVLADAGVSLTFHITDPLCPANRVPLRLTPQGVEAGTMSDPCWLCADIQTLGPLYFGYSLPSEAQRDGLLTTDSPETLALADQLFPPRAPYIAPLDQS